jgi:pSer/pThr/pTyr-binding forkhead associated (FHA) protein
MVHYYTPLATANIDAMSAPNTNPSPNPDQTGMSGFNAQSQMGLPEVLQMCCLSRRSGQITFRSGESYGFIYIQQGRVLHALCGTVEGEEAIYTMLVWPGGGFSLDEDILPHKKTVTLTWEQLLFEGARRADGGMIAPKAPSTITTAEPLTIRIQDNQPKLTVTRPDLPPIVHVLEQEYTHVGRAPGNEISLPYPSISNRHCIFVHSGPDIVLRDLNSSNGTYVNGEIISEVILRPGDLIQIGTVQIKFEPGIRRPKLIAQEAPAAKEEVGLLKTQSTTGALYYQTHKLPTAIPRPIPKAGGKAKDDSVYVKGESAISYTDLAKPEEKKSSGALPIILAVLVVLVLAGAAGYYYYFVMAPAAH